ncbi:nitroreductase family protein [Acinetobacter lwoffii]|jgi:nitroreductase|uniref:nitroreductase family protein n=1 Tax=Acinetobacter lwoffii TaxID=28090 RepID=UPI003F90F849
MFKGTLRKILPLHFKVYLKLCLNYFSDFKKYWRYSTINTIDSLENKECELILNYHSIEKGMLFSPMKPRFAMARVVKLHKYLEDSEIVRNVERSQIGIAYKVMIEYYELHDNERIDISDYYTKDQYEIYKKIVSEKEINYFSGKINYYKKDFYKDNSDFYNFSFSRKSIRNFTGEKVSYGVIKKAIELANNAPSVCNRQASKVYLLEDKDLIDFCLEVQGGLTGYTDQITQLLILTSSREYFYTVGERNQFYIDGGIYLMNLLYALHFYKIACCPANWGKVIDEEKKLAQKIDISDAEQIICMIPIGVATDNFNVTLSYRRSVEEVLKVIPAND